MPFQERFIRHVRRLELLSYDPPLDPAADRSQSVSQD